MQTISDLWNGNLAPCAHCGSHDPEANRLLTLLERNRESLYKGLTQEQKDDFQKYIDCSEAYLLRMMELAFCAGFSLGSRLSAESGLFAQIPGRFAFTSSIWYNT